MVMAVRVEGFWAIAGDRRGGVGLVGCWADW